MAGLYLHVPFCKQACYYCDFHFSTDQQDRVAVNNALAHELTLQKEYLNDSLETIYFGGGTPSVMNGGELETLFKAIRSNYSLHPQPEITLEANPDDLSSDKLQILFQQGVNRLSIGVQSFDNHLLKYLNRAHDAGTAQKCLEDVRQAGFTNFSIDLMYAIPGLTMKAWEASLKEVLKQAPEHISAYALTVEERTVFGNWSKRGKLMPMDEENAARQFEILMDVLEANGYEQYEISNFSKPGSYSRHNSSYWKGIHYLGVGPSAHSYNGETRQFNIRNNSMYIKSINQGVIPFEKEVLTSRNKINEYILTSLRTSWGCDLGYLKSKLGDDLTSRCGAYLDSIHTQALIIINDNNIRLTRKGKFLADKIAEDLMVDE